jgi:RNA polymerase sigma-70 factor (ECF subfamily)
MAGPDPEYETLFRDTYAPLVRALSLAAGSIDDAADAVQDAFVQLHRHWRRVRAYDNPAAWVRRVAINRIANQRRRRARRDVAAIAALGAIVDVSDHATGAGDRLDVLAAVAQLAPGQRLAIGLYHLAGLTVAETAAALGVSEGTVKSQLHDARAHLRVVLEVIDG